MNILQKRLWINILIGIVLIFGRGTFAYASLTDGLAAYYPFNGNDANVLEKSTKTLLVHLPNNPKTNTNACETESTLVKYDYLGVCGLTKSSDFSLTETANVTRIRIWYNTNIGTDKLTVKINGPNGYAWSGQTLKGNCDTYQKNWCEGLVTLNNQLAAGTYSVSIDSTSMCANPGGQTTLLVYGCPVTTINYTISTSASPTTGGSVTCTPNPVASGSNSTCTATANSGYSFASWSGDCSGTSTTCTLSNVNAQKSVTAVFNQVTVNNYSISTSANPTTGGSVACSPNPVASAGSSTCTATANSGYSFSSWSGDCAGTNATCTLSNVNAQKSVTALFKLATSQGCVAAYTLDGKLNIPYVSVPDAFGGLTMYAADMQLLPLLNPITFELLGAKKAVEVQSCVASTYSQDGKLHIPYVTVPDAFGGKSMYEADMQLLLPLSSPVRFQLMGARTTASPTTTRGKTGTIATGSETILEKSSIGSGGGTITVNNVILNSLTLTVPANAYPETRDFKITASPVTSHTFGELFNPISPLITIENGGSYSEDILTVKIPVKIPAGNFAMGFYYDENTKTLEGMPTVAQDENSITVAARHFSKFIITSILDSLLKRDIDTLFRPGIDDWQFTNYGSSIAPGGHCAGQSMTSMWYYYTQPDGKDLTLYERYDNNGIKPSTPDLWQDDSLGYRFASTIQKDVKWNDFAPKLWLKQRGINDELTWKLFAYSMQFTEEPQMVIVYKGASGHAMVVYRIKDGNLYIADPNYPGNIERRIEYIGGKLNPYESGANKKEIDAGNSTRYDKIGYMGKATIIDWNLISKRWTELKNGTIGNDRFPATAFVWKDNDGTYKDLNDGYSSPNKLLGIYAKALEQAIQIYRDGKKLKFDANGNIELLPGRNKLGLYVVSSIDSNGNPIVDDKGNKQFEYVDFKYINVEYVPFEINLIPNQGEAGTTVTITGTGFGKTQGTVSFNGTTATVTTWSDTEIITTVPIGATTGDVVVTANGVKSPGVMFIVNARLLEYKCDGKEVDYSQLAKVDKPTAVYYLTMDNKIHGFYQWWHDSTRSQLGGQGFYCNDKEEGLFTSWGKNGNKLEEVNFTNGLKNGLWIRWYENGNKKLEANYQENKLHGLWTTWYENGNKEQESNCQENRLNGLSTFWYENGHKSAEGTYKNGGTPKLEPEPDLYRYNKTGIWYYWIEDGTCLQLIDHDNNPWVGIRCP